MINIFGDVLLFWWKEAKIALSSSLFPIFLPWLWLRWLALKPQLSCNHVRKITEILALIPTSTFITWKRNLFKSLKLDFLFVCVWVAQLYLTLCDPMDYSPPGSYVHGILQVRISEWVAIPISRESSQHREWTQVSCIAGRFFTAWTTKEAQISCLLLLKSCLPGTASHVYWRTKTFIF